MGALPSLSWPWENGIFQRRGLWRGSLEREKATVSRVPSVADLAALHRLESIATETAQCLMTSWRRRHRAETASFAQSGVEYALIEPGLCVELGRRLGCHAGAGGRSRNA